VARGAARPRIDGWSAAGIAVTHGLPLVFVLTGQTAPMFVLRYYWLELTIVSVFAILKMMLAAGAPLLKRLQVAGFSALFYAVFIFLFGVLALDGFGIEPQWTIGMVALAAGTLAVLEVVSFLKRYVGTGAYLDADPANIGVGHLFRLTGNFLTMILAIVFLHGLDALWLAPYVLVAMRASADILAELYGEMLKLR
jgi:hypothetical protein